MHTLRKEDRDRSMANLVSFHDVPMPRMVAFTIDHVERHGGRVAIFSADRTRPAIAEHNRQFGTRLKSQEELIEAAKHGGNPANPVDRTSHCYRADATIAALLTRSGHPTREGGEIPRWAVGVDLADRRKDGTIEQESVDRFLAVARQLGYSFRQPYSSGSERHHVILVASPIARLEDWNVISENRHA